MCGTNGVTYPSICRLLQDTGNVEVAYAGDCDAEDCSGGPVSIRQYLIITGSLLNCNRPVGMWY